MAASAADQSAVKCSSLTGEKVAIAQQYTQNYYRKIIESESSFIREHTRNRPRRVTINDLELLTVIGRGAFGEVRLCFFRNDPTRTVYALKKLRKDVMIKRKQVQHVRAERDLMVEARRYGESEWLVDLRHTFQDAEHLYFVMEFCPGGDMMTWLINTDIFEEPVARFYVAELIQAVQSLHKLNYAHRDLKPDNILLDRNGHVKLTDFGLCKQAPSLEQATGGPLNAAGTTTDAHDGASVRGSTGPATASDSDRRHHWHRTRDRKMFFSTVGSPGYIAPEVLEKQGYSLECDWWSVGVILYEMLCGYPPFYGDDKFQTGHKILRWREFLEFPKGVDAISPAAMDLITGLLTDAAHRLTYEQITNHAFFAGVDWTTLRAQPAPFRITLSSSTDTRYFDQSIDDDGSKAHPVAAAAGGANESGPTHENDARYLFYGFTSKFDVAATTAAARPKATGPQAVGAARPTLQTFEEDD